MLALLMCACLAADPDPRFEAFAKEMSGVELTGSFTIDGMNGSPKQESYTIRKVEKLPQENLWRFYARIKYGETDVELPMDLIVLWAGDTPVITLDKVWLPGLGTFSARVVFHDNKYAGTWQHDDKGGHLFGSYKRVEAAAEGAPEKSTEPAKPKDSSPATNKPAEKTP